MTCPERPRRRWLARIRLGTLVRALLVLVGVGGATGDAAAQDGSYAPGQLPMPETYVVREGDTLWDISARYYGDPWHWPQIWSYNPDITNPHWIYPSAELQLQPPAELRARATADGEEGGEGAAGVPVRQLEPDTVLLRHQGYLDPDALDEVGLIEGAVEERMLLATGDRIYVRFPEDTKVDPGQRFTIFREIDGSDRSREEEGELVRIFGTVAVDSYDAERGQARAVITEALDPIQRGDRIAVMDRRFVVVPPRPNEKEVKAKVVATVRPRVLLAYDSVIFLNAGAEDGVRPGNRFFILQRGDRFLGSIDAAPERHGATVEPPAYDADRFPDEVVAEARVVHVRPNSCAALLTRTSWEIRVGDRAQMRVGF